MLFTVLASGSSGNANLVRTGNFGLLIDVGLGPAKAGEPAADGRQLLGGGQRGAAVARPCRSLEGSVAAFPAAEQDSPLLPCGPRGRADPPHAGPDPFARPIICCGFISTTRKWFWRRACVSGPCPCPTIASRPALPRGRANGSAGLCHRPGLLATSLAEALADVDVLAVEFNHDVAMERGSGREPRDRARAGGCRASVERAGRRFGAEIWRARGPGSVRHLVQLHLSRHCNSPRQRAARQTLKELGCGL